MFPETEAWKPWKLHESPVLQHKAHHPVSQTKKESEPLTYGAMEPSPKGSPTLLEAPPCFEAPPLADAVVGWYNFSWAEGSFHICLRPGGRFYCPEFPAKHATWEVEKGMVKINWERFGALESQKLLGAAGVPLMSVFGVLWMQGRGHDKRT